MSDLFFFFFAFAMAFPTGTVAFRFLTRQGHGDDRQRAGASQAHSGTAGKTIDR